MLQLLNQEEIHFFILPPPQPHDFTHPLPLQHILSSHKMYKALFFYAIFASAILAIAKPIEGNLKLEGLNNKIRSGAIAVANPGRPSDSRIQRVVSKDGVILNAGEEMVTPNGEVVDREGRPVGRRVGV